MPKKPDEIKKGLECCVDGNIVCAGNCVFDDDVKLGYPDCVKLLMTNALALIQQKEQENAEQAERIRVLEDHLREATKKIEQLEARVPRWISVEERMPERGVEVLGTNGKAVEMCTYWPGQPTPWESWTAFHFKPTHWMPLPEPPRRQTHDKPMQA